MASESVAFDRAVDYYDRTRGFPAGVETAVAAMLARAGDFNDQSRVLEVGIGTGRIGLPLSKHVRGYYGVDISLPMMNHLRSKQDGEPLYTAQADATQLPFPDNTFDGAVSVHVFHLIPSWQVALAEVERVLRPGAPLLYCWNDNAEDPRMQKLWDAWNSAIPAERRKSRGSRTSEDPEFIVNEGWQLHQHDQVGFTRHITPAKHIDFLRQRMSSRMWHLSDEEVNAGVAAVEAAIDSQFDDPNEAIEIPHSFHVQVYR